MSIQLKRSLASELDTSYILLQGQIGIEMERSVNTLETPFRFKIGDGVSEFKDLPYFSPSSDRSNCIDVSDTAPSDTTVAWIDTSAGGVLKYYSGSGWSPTKAVWG